MKKNKEKCYKIMEKNNNIKKMTRLFIRYIIFLLNNLNSNNNGNNDNNSSSEFIKAYYSFYKLILFHVSNHNIENILKKILNKAFKPDYPKDISLIIDTIKNN